MLNKPPEYMNDIIMSGVNRQRGPAVIDTSKLAAAHSAQQAKGIGDAEIIGKRIGLSQDQFGQRLGFAKDQLGLSKKYGNIATGLAGLGLGVTTATGMADKRRAQERLAHTQTIMDKLSQRGDADSLFLAEILKYYSE